MTVKVAQSSDEAVQLISRLRNGGLHPVDLALAAPLVSPGARPMFPVEVPSEEAELARALLPTK
jgi:hypothetical protein